MPSHTDPGSIKSRPCGQSGQSCAGAGLIPSTLIFSCQILFYQSYRYLMLWAGATGFPNKICILTQLLKPNEKNHLLYKSNSQIFLSLHRKITYWETVHLETSLRRYLFCRQSRRCIVMNHKKHSTSFRTQFMLKK